MLKWLNHITNLYSSVQFSVLCRPLLLLKYAKGCSSFDELYQAEIDTRDWTECSASKTKRMCFNKISFE